MSANPPANAAIFQEPELAEPLEQLFDSMVIAANDSPARESDARQRVAAQLREALGAVRTERTWIDVERLVALLVEMATARAKPSTRIMVRLPNAPTKVYAEYTLLSLAILQVLENAIADADELPQGKVWVDLDRALHGGAYLQITDNGPGMSRGMLRRAFAPFAGARHDLEGLALPLARAALEANGGDIELQSEPFVGTIAMIRLPRP